MKQRQLRLLGSMAGAVGALVISSTALAVVPNENRLPEWDNYGTKTVDFTNIAINYKNGRLRRGRWSEGTFFGDSSGVYPWEVPPSTFSLNAPTHGVNNLPFNGDIVIDARISSKGRLYTNRSSFGIYSNDAMFDAPVVEYGCNRKRTTCRSGKLVYGGDLTAFGWSASAGILEFEIGNLSGWALEQWEPGDQSLRVEHIMLNVPQFDLNGVDRVRAFNSVATTGFAVVPVPAAAWLFGSGLLGLAGVAMKKRRQA